MTELICGPCSGTQMVHQMSQDGRRKTEDGRRETDKTGEDGGRRTRRKTEDGKTEDGRRKTGDGRRETGDGRRNSTDGRRETSVYQGCCGCVDTTNPPGAPVWAIARI